MKPMNRLNPRIASLSAGTIGLLILLLAVGCSTPGSPDDHSSDASSQVDSLFRDLTAEGSPGAVSMVIRDGSVVHSKGYGLADLPGGRPLEPTTPIRLGSVSKQFTAMAVMMLAQQGRLAFDDFAVKTAPELSRFPKVTVRHLLNHTSGLPDYYEVLGVMAADIAASDGDPLLTNADSVAIYRNWGQARFDPGDRYEYSNPGYEVLGLIVERTSGQSFAQFLAERIFQPLGMKTAAVRDRPETVIAGRAIGYRPDRQGGGWTENDDHAANWIVGAGGVYASVEDLLLWDQALDSHRLVSREILSQAHSPAKLNDGQTSNYGFGWALADRVGHPAVHHNGSWVGFRTAMARFPQQRLTVIVLSNASANAGELLDDVAQVFLTPRD